MQLRQVSVAIRDQNRARGFQISQDLSAQRLIWIVWPRQHLSRKKCPDVLSDRAQLANVTEGTPGWVGTAVGGTTMVGTVPVTGRLATDGPTTLKSIWVIE